MSERILSLNDAAAIGDIVDAAEQGSKVARLVDPHVVCGQARAIVIDPDRAYFPGPGDDVRDCCLWVTTQGGMEEFWPVAELVGELRSTTFVIGYEPPPGVAR